MGWSSQSGFRIRLASPWGSSNWRDRNAQKKPTSPMAARISDAGISQVRISRDYFNLNAFNDTVTDDADIASAAASGVANPANAKGTANTL